MNKHSFGILPLRNSMVREKEPLYGLPYKKFIVGTDLGIALWDGQTESWGPVSGRHVEIDNNHFNFSLPRGKYLISGFIDKNRNGFYDSGSIIPLKLAETFAMGKDTVRVRARFETTGLIFEFK